MTTRTAISQGIFGKSAADLNPLISAGADRLSQLAQQAYDSLQVNYGKYYVVVRIPEINGKTKQKWIPTNILAEGNNKRRAQKAMREILEDLSRNETLDPYNLMFIDWIDAWLEQKKNEVRQDTYEGYELFAKIHIKPYFKELGVSLKNITPQQIQSYYNQKSKTLSANSLKKHHVVIHGALQEALRKNMILFDPSERVTLRAFKRRREKGSCKHAEWNSGYRGVKFSLC